MSKYDMAVAELLQIGKKSGCVTDDDIIDVTIKYDISTLKIESIIECLLIENININEQKQNEKVSSEKGDTALPENDNSETEKLRRKCRNVIDRKLKYEEERIKLLDESGDIVKDNFFNDFERARCQSTYMPVVVLAFIETVDENGIAKFQKLVECFKHFYKDRKEKGLVVERSDSIFVKGNPTDKEVRRLILFNPLGRSCLVKYFSYDKDSDVLSINANLWSVLKASDMSRLKTICNKKISKYFNM